MKKIISVFIFTLVICIGVGIAFVTRGKSAVDNSIFGDNKPKMMKLSDVSVDHNSNPLDGLVPVNDNSGSDNNASEDIDDDQRE